MLESGMIVMWYGSIESIPDGWLLCDGSVGTPDLRNRFIIGAGDTYNPGDEGGSTVHTHDFTTDGHSHELLEGDEIGMGNDHDSYTTTDTDSGTTDEASTLPPYHSLVFMMKD